MIDRSTLDAFLATTDDLIRDTDPRLALCDRVFDPMHDSGYATVTDTDQDEEIHMDGERWGRDALDGVTNVPGFGEEMEYTPLQVAIDTDGCSAINCPC